MGTVKFILRSERPNKKGKDKGRAPMDMIYSLHGQRKFFRTKVKLFPINWDHDTQEAVFRGKDVAKKMLPTVDFEKLLGVKDVSRVNDALANYRVIVEGIEAKFEANGVIYSSNMVKLELEKMKAEKATTKAAPVIDKVRVSDSSNPVLDLIDEYIDGHKVSRAKGSLNVYRHLKNRLAAMMEKEDIKIAFEDFNMKFMERFQNFLIESCKLSDSTTAKQISVLRSVLNYAIDTGKKIDLSFKNFKKITVEDSEIIALTEQELIQLRELDLSKNKSLDQVRDVFVFACYAGGLRYSDLADLKRDHIQDGMIKKICVKTKKPLRILLTEVPLAILEKYKDRMKPLPVISNQKMNGFLKGKNKKDAKGNITRTVGVCELAGINASTEYVTYNGGKADSNFYPKYELVGAHTARKSFISLSSEKGMSPQEIMKITGHKDFKSYSVYDDVNLKRQNEAMKKIWDGNSKKDELKTA